jgi:TPR repeat protein
LIPDVFSFFIFLFCFFTTSTSLNHHRPPPPPFIFDITTHPTLRVSFTLKGHASAQYNLGAMFATGRGVEKDLERAVHLYHQVDTTGGRKKWLHFMWWWLHTCGGGGGGDSEGGGG